MPPRRNIWFDLQDETLAAPAVSIIGLPFDGSTSLKAGAAAAPEKLRAISRTSDPVTRRGKVITGLTLRDFGDVAARDAAGRALPQGDYLSSARERIERAMGGRLTIVLGGDNSVSIPALQAFTRCHGPSTGIVWFDAHPDLFEAYDGNPDSHACALRRAMVLCGTDPGQVVLLGTRSFSAGEARFIQDQRIEMVTAADCRACPPETVASRIARRLKGLSAVYLAIDIDGFDASCAPGTGYPMPGGPGAEVFFAILEKLFEKLPIRAMDITEIAPPLDTNDLTGFLGVQVVLESLGALPA